MRYQIFSDNEWVFPDSEIGAAGKAELHAARGGDVCFQVLIDRELAAGESVDFSFALDGCTLEPYQLLPAYVSENSGVKTHTTQNYDEVKDFVIRKAPFWIYDVTQPVADGIEAGRAAFFLRVNVALDAPVGTYEAPITVKFADACVEIPVAIRIYNAQIPALKSAEYHMINWLYYPSISKQHNVEP